MKLRGVFDGTSTLVIGTKRVDAAGLDWLANAI
jgi:hypothetical protein